MPSKVCTSGWRHYSRQSDFSIDRSPVVVVIANVVSKKSLQMAFVESEDVVESIAAAASHPALGNPVLPRALDRGLHASNLPSANGSGNIQSILLIVIEEKEPERIGREMLRAAAGRSNYWSDAG
jgi:hypothetical protein